MCGVRLWVCQTSVIQVHRDFRRRETGTYTQGCTDSGRNRGSGVRQSERGASEGLSEGLEGHVKIH